MALSIVVVGSSNTDMILKLNRIPRSGETVLGGEFVTAAGGKGANQAVAAARAGGDVTFVARVGRDMFGERAVAGFIQHGIDVQHVQFDEAPSGVALIFVDENGENSIGVASGANARLLPDDIRLAENAFAIADVVMMQLETPLQTVETAAELAAANSAIVILNPAPAQPLPDSLLRNVSILTPNETEAELLTGINVGDEHSCNLAAEVLLDKGVQVVIITLGSRGAFVASKSERELVPAFQVDQVDTTAAGDTFNGALAVALADGMQITDAVRFANAAAAVSVTRMGAQPSCPSREEIETLLSRFQALSDEAYIPAPHLQLRRRVAVHAADEKVQ